MQILLVSTQSNVIENVQLALTDSPDTLIVSTTPSDALKVLKLNNPACVIIDVPSMDVEQFAQKIGEIYHKKIRPAIIAIDDGTSDLKKLLSLNIQGFGVYDDSQFAPILTLISQCQQPTLAHKQNHRPAIIARTHRGDERIFIDDIFYCQAEQKYTKIHHRHGTTLTDDTLKSLESAHPNELLRIHRHTLVGTCHIHRVMADNGHQLVLYGVQTPLAISRRCLSDVRLALANLGKTPSDNLPKNN